MVVMVFGLPGSGKSHFASWFANLIDAEYINSDRLRKEMIAQRNYSEREKRSVYNEMLLQMRELLKQNRNLVIDATFYKKEIRKKFIEEAGGIGNLIFIEIKADEQLIHERLKRKRPYSEADFEVYKKIKQQWEPMTQPHLILLSTDDNLPEMLKKAMSYINQADDERTNK